MEETTAVSLMLYVTSGTPNSEMAMKQLQLLLTDVRDCHLKVIDLRQEPMRALQDGIVAVPTLELNRGAYRTRIVGDLSESSMVRNLIQDYCRSK